MFKRKFMKEIESNYCSVWYSESDAPFVPSLKTTNKNGEVYIVTSFLTMPHWNGEKVAVCTMDDNSYFYRLVAPSYTGEWKQGLLRHVITMYVELETKYFI